MRNTYRPNTELLQCDAGVKVGEKYKSNMIHNVVCDRYKRMKTKKPCVLICVRSSTKQARKCIHKEIN